MGASGSAEGDGERGSGERGSLTAASGLPALRGAGGGGGPGFFPEADDDGGGGGGGARPLDSLPFARGTGGSGGVGLGDGCWFVFCCSSRKKSTINSWLSLIKSSVRPLSLRSLPKCSRHKGSKASSSGNSDGPKFPFIMVELECAGAGGGGGRLARVASGVGAEE